MSCIIFQFTKYVFNITFKITIKIFIYFDWCDVCHGPWLNGNGNLSPGADLGRGRYDGDGELFRDALVRGGALSRLINKWIF